MSIKNRLAYMAALASLITEWAEFVIFIYLSPVIGKIFFPSSNSSSNFLLILCIFAVSYIVRPLGAVMFGHYADTKGRNIVMRFSILLMSLSTFLIGVLPTYSSIGIAAPFLLLFLRILQGIAMAAEFNNAANYILEHSKKKILASSLISAGGSAGMCLGAALVSMVDANVDSISWRLPFFITSFLSFFIFIIRRNLIETPEFIKVQNAGNLDKFPLSTLIKSYRKELLIIAIYSAFIGVFLYGGHIYLVTFLVRHSNYEMLLSSRIAGYSELGLTLLLPILGFIGDKYKLYKRFFIVGTLLLGVSGPFLFYIGKMGEDKLLLLSLVIIMYVVSNALFSVSVFFYIYKLLPVNVRCTGTGMAYSVSMALFGGTAPILSEILVSKGLFLAPGIYMLILSMLTLWCFLYLQPKVLYSSERG